ncbi:deoxyribodipyrimidine photo-lyase [Orenia marismortui]|uniref:deoxyribodipyrimidine photo-lyase n=1 Tax=Orenia marismortui TaxID=46469 RepID=UPI0003716AC7|nr:deoxyribodipyrimidine photo-lyase [Orenia marismortui]
MIQKTRIKALNNNKVQVGDYVLYWMQASHRTEYNHALELAIEKANSLDQTLLVYFGITDRFPEANARHYYFMLEGLQEVKDSLYKRGINFIIRYESPEVGVQKLAKKASMIVVDRGYLNIERRWRKVVAENIDCPLIQVESNLIVPIEEASNKEEYAAYTIRKKINKQLDKYLVPLKERELRRSSLDIELPVLDISNLDKVIKKLDVDINVNKVDEFVGGTLEAIKYFEEFIDNKLDKYGELSNDPSLDYSSHLSPYLHFGQISPLYIALEVGEVYSPGRDDFLEQLIIRRELSFNYVYYNQNYDSNLEAILPDWALKTLNNHREDLREDIYTREEFEQGLTHDIYWNAAQMEMVLTGKMQGYMRMYWGKKILEWTTDPEEAFQIALYLNNKYNLDGRDPNAFAGIAWCFGKHDRAWREREIFGKVRYMNANGLKRKFDITIYVKRIADLCKEREVEAKLPITLF